MINFLIIIPIIVMILFFYKRPVFGYIAIGFVFLFNYFNIKKAYKTNNKEMSLKLLRKFIKIFLAVSGIELKLENKELLNKEYDDNVIIIGNHTSNLDIMNIILNYEKNFFPISKIELTKAPFVKMLMSPLETLYIKRDDLRQSLKVIMEATKKLSKDKSFIVYPEGTRNETLGELKAGSFTPISKKGGYVIITKNYDLRQCLESRKAFQINKIGTTKVIKTLHFEAGIKTTQIAKECKKILEEN